MPIRQGGNLAKNATIWERRSFAQNDLPLRIDTVQLENILRDIKADCWAMSRCLELNG